MDTDDLLLYAALGVGGYFLWKMLYPAPAQAALPPPDFDAGTGYDPNAVSSTSQPMTYDPTTQFGYGDSPMTAPPNIAPVGFDTSNDLDVATRTLYGEARGESYGGQVAVINVIHNRLRHGGFGATLAAVCLAPGFNSTAYHQFSCWNRNDPNRAAALALSPIDPTYIALSQIVSGVLSGKIADNTGGALYYFNPSLANPSWAANKTVTANIGNQVFMG